MPVVQHDVLNDLCYRIFGRYWYPRRMTPASSPTTSSKATSTATTPTALG